MYMTFSKDNLFSPSAEYLKWRHYSIHRSSPAFYLCSGPIFSVSDSHLVSTAFELQHSIWRLLEKVYVYINRSQPTQTLNPTWRLSISNRFLPSESQFSTGT